ncbi:MAG TPA: ABC transporter permease [Longimicrobiales bacterium]|nr:ABC transporter permease [Longimicrobiales bacterium]
MSWLTDMRERVRSLLFRRREERELREELAFHLEMEQAANERRGMSAAEARRQARLTLGGVERTKEEVRDARGVRPLEDLVRDIRFAFRSFGRSPGFTVTAVLVLGLGIGANTAIFSAVRAVILEPLPLSDPGSLYMLWESNPEKGWERETAAPANFLDWKERVTAFRDVEAYSWSPFQVTLTGLDRPRVVDATEVTGGFFSMVGVEPMLGRGFTEEETWATAETPVLLSAGTWRTIFGGDPGVLETFITVNGAPARIVGVMADGFQFPTEEVDLWAPFGWSPEFRTEAWFRRAHWIRPVARLNPGVDPDQASAELEEVAAQLEREHPVLNRVMGAGMTRLDRFLLGDMRTPMLVLLAAVGVLLLIACANVGNLLLVRASGRGRDLALRAALGAGRGRLVRQMLTESLALAALGGGCGILVGLAGTRLLERLQPEGLLRVSSFPVDGTVVGYTVAVTAAAAVLFGAFPALVVRRTGAGAALREAGRSGSHGRGSRRVVGTLVAAEVALAVILVLGAGLLVRSVASLRQVDPGFDADGVAVVTLNLPSTRYETPDQVTAFYDDLLGRMRTLPEVVSAAGSTTMPLRDRGFTSDFSVAGWAADEYGSEVVRRRVTPGYFETMGVPLLEGRLFTAADRPESERVALINEAMARRYFPGEEPIGQRITADRFPDSTSVWRTIVGVVGSERQNAVAMPAQVELIEPFHQYFGRRMHIYFRVAAGDPTDLVPTIRSIVAEMDTELPLFSVADMTEVHADSMARDRFVMLLLLAFAAVALLLALVGVYGVTAQAARQRLPEMGLRMALGARAADLVRLTLGRSVVLIVSGLAVGLGAALIATRAMTGMLYGVAPNDPVTFIAVALLLAAAALGASWLPARRAARVDPARTLQAE